MFNRKVLTKVPSLFASTLFKRNYFSQFHIQRSLPTQSIRECYSEETLTSHGYTPLHYCTDPVKAKLLLEKGADPNAMSSCRQTPLHTQDNPEIVKLLIKYGADVNAEDFSDSNPVHTCRNAEVAEILIQNGANGYARNAMGWVAAAFFHTPEIEKIIDEEMEKQVARERMWCTAKVLGVVGAFSALALSSFFYLRKEKEPVVSENVNSPSNKMNK